jgi:hypothetical protein
VPGLRGHDREYAADAADEPSDRRDRGHGFALMERQPRNQSGDGEAAQRKKKREKSAGRQSQPRDRQRPRRTDREDDRALYRSGALGKRKRIN